MKRTLLCPILLLVLVTSLAAQSDQTFDLESFTDPDKYGWGEFEERRQAQRDLLAREKLLQIYQMEKLSVAANVSKAAVAPGWGHFTAEYYTKGQILLGLHVIFLGSTIYFYDQAMIHYDKYKEATQIEQMRQHYNDALTPYRFAQAFGGLWVLVWGYTIYDTFRVTDDYNASLWDKIISEYQESNFRLTPTGFIWRF